MSLSVDNISLLSRMLRKKIPTNGDTKINLTLDNLGKLLDEARDEGRESAKQDNKYNQYESASTGHPFGKIFGDRWK